MKKEKPTLLIDFDALIFKACFASETRSVLIKNTKTGDTYQMANRTAFWGRGKEPDGFLKALNSENGTDYKKSDFEVQEIQTPESFDSCCFLIKSMIKGYCNLLDTDKWYGYMGGSDNFRETTNVYIPYKKNRESLVRPLFYDKIKEYLDTLGVQRIHGKEVDDQIATDMYSAMKKYKKTGKESDKLIGCVVDKDYMGCDGFWFYKNHMVEPFLVQGLGNLWLEDKEVKGCGRAWKYFQFMGDKVDGFYCTAFTEKKWGQMSTYKVLKDCKTDKEYMQGVVSIYKNLYPKSFETVNFKGESITVNWYNVLQECIMFAHLQRWDGDRIVLNELLHKLGLQEVLD